MESKIKYSLDYTVALNCNENPLGSSHEVIKALRNSDFLLSRYPDDNCEILKKSLSELYGIKSERFVISNGSYSLLTMLVQCFASQNRPIIVSEYAFIGFNIIAKQLNVPLIKVPMIDWRHDVKKIAESVDETTSMILIDNPNNPTGTYISTDEIVELLMQIPETCFLILDEAYYEYIQSIDYPNAIKLQTQYPNVIITRTFSKAYALAALRVGYSISNAEVATRLNSIRLPFNVSNLAQIAASVALQDQLHLNKTIQNNEQGKMQFAKAFEKLKLSFIESYTNFITVDVQTDAIVVYKKLLAKGIIVLPLFAYGMPHHLRISIGLAHENQLLINELESILGGAQISC